ncbi:enoyl-CoA hydratase/isomerase, partial [Neoconidiobolus thromboides FSU 785]
VEKQGDVYIMNLVNKDNRLTPVTIPVLIKAMDEIEQDFLSVRKENRKDEKETVGAALVTIGNGHIYSNGLDFALIMSGQISTIDFFENYYHKLCLRILTLPFPTVAAINGHAFAGGMMFALSHDYRVMRDDRGFLCMPEVDLPGALSPGMLSILKTSIPNKVDLRDIILQGKRFAAKEAYHRGIVDATASEDKVLETAIGIANKWSGKVVKSKDIYKFLRLEL